MLFLLADSPCSKESNAFAASQPIPHLATHHELAIINVDVIPVHPQRHPMNQEIWNSHSYQSVQRQRQLTLGDLLLENRIVFLQGEIHTGNANEVVMKLLYLQSENRRKDISFYINSPGGDVIAPLAIYDTMQMLTCPIATYCVGQAAAARGAVG
ncbi:MAG: ATP-dependent Clp protease proteolytic subunit [Pirellulaceae bacterium]